MRKTDRLSEGSKRRTNLLIAFCEFSKRDKDLALEQAGCPSKPLQGRQQAPLYHRILLSDSSDEILERGTNAVKLINQLHYNIDPLFIDAHVSGKVEDQPGRARSASRKRLWSTDP